MDNLKEKTMFVLNEALNNAISKFESNIKCTFIHLTERGAKVKMTDKTTNKDIYYLVVPKASKVTFENLNGTAQIKFNHLSKDNVKFALYFYNQIVSIKQSQYAVNKMNGKQLKDAYLKSKDNLFDNHEYRRN